MKFNKYGGKKKNIYIYNIFLIFDLCLHIQGIFQLKHLSVMIQVLVSIWELWLSAEVHRLNS